MPGVKKAVKAKVAKAKVVKAKRAKTVAAKPVAKKPIAKAPLAEKKVRKTRGPNKAKGTFTDLLKIQSQLENAKKGAKADLKKQYESLIKESEKIKAQYKNLFSENIESAPKVRATVGEKAVKKVAGGKPFSLKEIQDFVEQKKEGIPIKLAGRRAKSVEKIEVAFKKTEEPDEILKILNQ